MRYYKQTDGDYITGVYTANGDGDGGITQREYDGILAAIRSMPTAPEGYGYRLKTDMTYELYELPVPELTDSEALDIITGGSYGD